MDKLEFLEELRAELSGKINEQEIERVIEYYGGYFDEAEDFGKTEREVADELESPRALAAGLSDEPKSAKKQREAGRLEETKPLEGVLVATREPVLSLRIRAANPQIGIIITNDDESRLEVEGKGGKFPLVRYGFEGNTKTLYFEEDTRRVEALHGRHGRFDRLDAMSERMHGDRASVHGHDRCDRHDMGGRREALRAFFHSLHGHGEIRDEIKREARGMREEFRGMRHEMHRHGLRGIKDFFEIVEEYNTPLSLNVYLSQKNALNGVEIRLINGSITLGGAGALTAKRVSLCTVNGAVEISSLKGEEARVHTINGAISVKETHFESLYCHSVNGAVTISPDKTSDRGVKITAGTMMGRVKASGDLADLAKSKTATREPKAGHEAYAKIDLRTLTGAITVND